jgi:hypothetical protein
MTVFDQAKTVTALQAAERYANVQATGTGYRVKACCPLHNEKTPSCTFYGDGTFYCYGCHAGGTSIDLTAKLFGITPREAARKICEDYGLTIPTGNATVKRDSRPPKSDVNAAISWLDTQTVRYVRWCDNALRTLTGDTDEDETARTLFLREREKAQRLSDAILEATQERNEKKLEQLLIANAKWAKDLEEQLDIWKQTQGDAPEVIE